MTTTTMAMTQRAMAQWDEMTMTLAAGDGNGRDVDGGDVDGDGATGNEVDNDGDDNDYGNG